MRTIAIVIIILGVLMFFFGASMFSYAGPSLSPFVSKLGEISFLGWWAVIIFGVAMLIAFKKEKK